VLFRRLVILHLTLFENLFIFELVDAVHDSIGTPHHEVGLGNVFALDEVVAVIIVLVFVIRIRFLILIELLHILLLCSSNEIRGSLRGRILEVVRCRLDTP